MYCKYIALLSICIIYLSSCATSRLCKKDQRKLAGKTFVITGASSGFGRGVAEQLGQYHANVVLAARRTNLLEEIAANIKAAGGDAIVVTTDVSKPGDIQQLAAAAIKKYGKVDVWINNAGVASVGRFWEIPVEEHVRVIDVNLNGVIYGSYTAVNLFRKQGYGTLINTGSVDSEVPLAYQSSYSASKAGVRSLGEVLHQELRISGDKHIRVVTIMPWAADTPFWGHSANHTGGMISMAALDDPQKIVNAMLYASLHRNRELPVGWKARMSYHSHRMFPHFTERFAAKLAHKYQMNTQPAVPDTSGSLFKPVMGGTGVDDDMRDKTRHEQKRNN